MWKRKAIVMFMICTCVLLASCGANAGRTSTEPEPEDGYVLKDNVTNINEHLNYDDSELHKIYFAGGCFWGVEAYFAKLYGV